MLQQLKDRYARYEAEARKARDKAPVTAGLFGMGDDPRKHPCHMAFYEDVEQWVKDFLKTRPDEHEVYEAVFWIVSRAADHEDQDVYWFMYAAHGHCRELIPLLTPEDCAALMQFYDSRYPRRNRMPVQKQMYKLLRAGAARK